MSAFWRKIPAKKALVILLATLTSGLLALWGLHSMASEWVRTKVHARVPEVTAVGPVSLTPYAVTLRDVVVHKEGAEGRLTEVRVGLGFDWESWAPVPVSVAVNGGTLVVNLDQWSYNDEAPRKEGQGRGLSRLLKVVKLDTLKVSHGDYQGVARGVTLKKGSVCCAEGGLVLDPGLQYSMFIRDNRVDLGRFCVDLKAMAAQVQRVSATIDPPEGLPGLRAEGHDVLAEEVLVELKAKHVTMNRLSISDLLTAHLTRLSFKPDEPKIILRSKKLETTHPWLASDVPLEPVEFADLELEVPYDGYPRVASLRSREAELRVDLDLRKISGEASCNDWVQALPSPKNPAFDGNLFKGDLSFTVSMKDVATVDLRYNCKAMCSAEYLSSLKGVFKYEAYAADGRTTFTRTSGPGSKDWVPVASLPTHIPQAFVNLEDPSYFKHRGLLKASLIAALRRNLDRGEMYVGGSTIPQQLAKNLWLRRDKTVTRKAKEAFHALALESCFSKEEMLELYLNVVEYAPDVYGIGPASKHYFNKEAHELTPEEAYYFASILPHPKSATPPDQGGLGRARRLMAQLAEDGRVPKGLVFDSLSLDTSDWDTLE